MRAEVRVDVSAAAGTGERLAAAASVLVPDGVSEAVVLFGFPGGGYNRHYYDLHPDLDLGPDLDPGAGGPGTYSQAAHHTGHGIVFAACDHLGVGDSDTPQVGLDLAAVGRADAALATVVRQRLTDGTLAEGIGPIRVRAAIGIGQSYGGLVLTTAQARTPVFDGVAFLGWSGVQTLPPWSSQHTLADVLALRAGNGLDHPARRTFHHPDVPEPIVVADLTKLPTGGSAARWSTRYLPGGPAVAAHNPLARGIVAEDAAAITVPVFVGTGEIDVVPDLRAEAAAYPGSSDLTLVEFARMAHMHNFASTRQRLWRRLEAWAGTVAAG